MDDEVEAPVDELEAHQEAEAEERDLGDAGSYGQYGTVGGPGW